MSEKDSLKIETLLVNNRPISARTLQKFYYALKIDPYLSHSNELKYICKQFSIGKYNPKLKSKFELRFQKAYT